MSFDGKRLAEDLLEQAKVLLDLAKPDSDGPDQAAVSSRPEKRGRPKEAKLRRSISTAYYSLFSLLVYEAATVVVGVGKEKKALRGYVIRAISHEIPIDLVDIARICHNLQVQCHEADYNLVRSFTKEEAIDIVNRAEKVHQKWKTIKDSEARKVFLMALLVNKLVQTSGTTIGAPRRTAVGT